MLRISVLWMTLVLTMIGCGVPDVTEDSTATTAGAASNVGPGTVPSADGVEIAYTTHRVGRTNLVMVHGWMCDQSYWDQQVPSLAEAFGVVTVDLAGHGASGLNREHWTIASLGADVTAVISKLELENVIVVGHSMGGLVALDVARRLPGTVIGVIGIDTLNDADEEYDPAQLEPLLAALNADFESTCSRFVRSMFVQGSDPTLIDPIVDDMCTGPGEVGAALIGAFADVDLKQAFTDAGVPIRSINADLWPTDVAGNQELADYNATILEGFGHFLMQEAPDQVTDAIIDTALAIAGGAAAGNNTQKTAA